MRLVEQHLIRKTDSRYAAIDRAALPPMLRSARGILQVGSLSGRS